MKIAITQPNYLPWLGYFDLLDSVDHWVVLDNVQLARRSFTVRNRIRISNEKTSWLTVSLYKAPRSTHITDSRLVMEEPWWEDHARKIEAAYRSAPHFDAHFQKLQKMLAPVTDDGEDNLAAYNARQVLALAELIGVDVPEVSFASALVPELEGDAQDKILSLCECFSTTEYYNFSGGVNAGLYHAEAFQERGITLFRHAFAHPVYPQPHDDFLSHLSVVDALLCVGASKTRSLIREGSGWQRMEA